VSLDPTDLPIAQELFAQWQRARGGRVAAAALRPFSRQWEELLEDAGLRSATERNEAEHDARALESAGWVTLKTVRYKPHLLQRIAIPLIAEERWCQAFGFVPTSNEEARLIREYSWEPRLAFLRDAPPNLSFAELKQINEFLRGGNVGEVIPIKERSLEIFGDEKRLDALFASTLFRPDRLNLRNDLGCELVREPLAWKRGPREAVHQPVIVIENAATWHSYCRWNEQHMIFSAVIYGCGNRFVDGVRFLGDVFHELGAVRNVFYFGDLDPHGLLIPQEASNRAKAIGMAAIKPHLWSYRQLLLLGNGREQPWEFDTPAGTLCDWLADCAEPVRQLFASGRRLPQEHVGWKFLRVTVPPPDRGL